MVELLLARGADPNKADKYGATPCSVAAQNGHEAVVQLLQCDGTGRANVDVVLS